MSDQARVHGVAAAWLILLLQLCMLNEGAFTENLNETVVYDLHLVWLEEVNRMLEDLAASEIFSPIGVRNVH